MDAGHLGYAGITDQRVVNHQGILTFTPTLQRNALLLWVLAVSGEWANTHPTPRSPPE
ncbi:hypothetical protein FRAAL2951 [Frankia alni ACN14a]|uniref:Uncharacterized protein n=1 Tax=Frankia alni (strain DSM 45986 / CECT 9034 / ACN14a) TaxID=326424 RepID=Q0RLK9_FRAAA|nr:hypothetical protein FRAAL2951 [Frankia alni ACN14a]